jgi:23S rRNA (uracil1939-C5)-methyltransferase
MTVAASRFEGRTWFVLGALAGEEVEARVLGAHGKVVEARTERVFKASELRRAVRRRALRWLQRAALAPRTTCPETAHARRATVPVAGVEPEEWAAPLSGPEFGYRRRARVAVRWDMKAKKLEVGFRAAGSQDIVAIDQCPVLVQPLQPIMTACRKCCALEQAAGAWACGVVQRFIAGRVAAAHGAAVRSDLTILKDFCALHEAQLWLQGDGEPQPVEAGQSLGYRLESWDLAGLPAGDFIQVNAGVNEAMVAQALDWLKPTADERVLDLFCGLGNFALPLAQSVREVVAVEGVQAMVERAAANAVSNNLHNAKFFQADLSQPLTDAEWAGRLFCGTLGPTA